MEKTDTIYQTIFKKLIEWIGALILTWTLCYIVYCFSVNCDSFPEFFNKMLLSDLLVGLIGVFAVNLICWIVTFMRRDLGQGEKQKLNDIKYFVLGLSVVILLLSIVFGVLSKVALQNNDVRMLSLFHEKHYLFFAYVIWGIGTFLSVICDVMRSVR